MDTNVLEKKVDELVFELYNVPDTIRKLLKTLLNLTKTFTKSFAKKV